MKNLLHRITALSCIFIICIAMVGLPALAAEPHENPDTVLVVFIINMGYLLRNSFEQIFVLYNPLVYEVADVFETYVYRIGLLEVQFDYATAVGVFQSLVGMVFLLAANYLANKFGGRGIF